MKKFTVHLCAVFAFLVMFTACDKDDKAEVEELQKGSITMTFRGKKYTKVDQESLIMAFSTTAVKGVDPEFLLTVGGVGPDGSTRNISTEPDSEHCGLTLTGEMVELFTATKGTVKRNGNKLEISVEGITLDSQSIEDTETLTATIKLKKVVL